MSLYLDNYHEDLDRRLQAKVKGTEMITELYVPRSALPSFLDSVRADFRQHDAQLIYGTIRLIEKDDESMLAWAREPWVCIVMNLHVDHDESGLRKAADNFRRLIDRAIEFGGSYLPHLPPMGEPPAGRKVLPANGRVPAPQAPLRSERGLPKRLVSPLQANVLRSALSASR